MFLSLPEVPLPGSQSLIPTVHSNFATLAHSQLVLAQDWAIEWEAKKVEWISLKNMFIKPRLWPFPSVICCAELLLRCCPWGWSVFFGHPFTSPSLWCSLQTSTTSGHGCCWVQASEQGWLWTSKGMERNGSSISTRAPAETFWIHGCSLGGIPNTPHWANVACAHNQHYTHRQVHTSQILSLQEFCGVKSFSELQEEFLLNTEFLQQVFQGKLMGVLPL